MKTSELDRVAQVPCSCTRPVFRVQPGAGAEQIGHIKNHTEAVLVFGPNASAGDVTATLDTLQETTCRAIVFTARESLPDFQPLIDDDRLFYLACGELPPRELDALTDAALGERKPEAALDRYLNAANLRWIALAQSVAELANALRGAAASAVAAARTRCVLFDSHRGTLWAPDESTSESPAAGLIGFIFRTGVTLCVPHVAADPRFDRDLDDPDGNAGDRFLGVPLRANGRVVAVLTAMRPSDASPFEPLDVAAMEALAEHASPYAAAWLDDSPADGGPFRSRALRAAEPQAAAAEPLRLESPWVSLKRWFVG